MFYIYSSTRALRDRDMYMYVLYLFLDSCLTNHPPRLLGSYDPRPNPNPNPNPPRRRVLGWPCRKHEQEIPCDGRR